MTIQVAGLIILLVLCSGILLGTSWTVQALQPNLRRQAKERRRLNAAWEEVRANLQQQHQDSAHDELHGGIAVVHPSDSPRFPYLANTQSDPLVQITFPITIYVSDESAHEQVEAAVEDLLV